MGPGPGLAVIWRPGPDGPMGPPPGDMAEMQSHMDDAAAHGPQDPRPGNPDYGR